LPYDDQRRLGTECNADVVVGGGIVVAVDVAGVVAVADATSFFVGEGQRLPLLLRDLVYALRMLTLRLMRWRDRNLLRPLEQSLSVSWEPWA